jgi:hypothetical protein
MTWNPGAGFTVTNWPRAMTALRQRMVENMRLRNLSELLGRPGGTDAIPGRGGLLLSRARSWQRTERWTLKMCLVQLGAETSKPNGAGAVSAKEVNRAPRALREEEEILQISRWVC